jgi:hypothetical protein
MYGKAIIIKSFMAFQINFLKKIKKVFSIHFFTMFALLMSSLIERIAYINEYFFQIWA